MRNRKKFINLDIIELCFLNLYNLYLKRSKNTFISKIICISKACVFGNNKIKQINRIKKQLIYTTSFPFKKNFISSVEFFS